MSSLVPLPGERRLGTAAWADASAIEAKHAYHDGMVWLGRLKNETPIGYTDDRHVCLVSGSRGGKGTTSIVNNLCVWPGSVVVVDPKGENATITAARRGHGSDLCEGMGQAVHVLDPFRAATVDDAYRSRFNPFDALHPENDETIDEASRLADALVVVHGDSKDPFWDESARALIKGLILHVLTAPEFEGRRNLVTLRTLVMRGDWEGVQALKESGDEDIPGAQALLWTQVSRSNAFNGLVAGIGDSFLNMILTSPKQFESVLQVANRNTEFLDSPAMQRCVETSDFRLSDLKTNPDGVSLYLSLPQRYMNTHYRWLRMMITLTVTEMEIVKGQPASGHRVLVMLDEFAGLKRMEIIENAVAQIAGFGVKLFFILQSLEQLKAVYKDNWETFLANSGLKVFFGLEDHFSRDYVSKLIGETEVVRDVRSASESFSESESTSESESKSRSETFGENRSHGRSVSHGTSRSISRSESKGTSDSRSHSTGGSTGVSAKRRGLFGEDRTYSGGKNWSEGRSHGTSQGTSISHTDGTSDSVSESQSEGTSYSVGTTTGTTRGTTKGTTRGVTTGSSETIHRRALISPDEIGQTFSRVDDSDHPAYPGLALAVVSGAPPMVLRRVNYYEDYQFVERFDPHPDHDFLPAVQVDVSFLPDHAALFQKGRLELKGLIAPGATVRQGDDVAIVHARVDQQNPVDVAVNAPYTGLICAVRKWGAFDESFQGQRRVSASRESRRRVACPGPAESVTDDPASYLLSVLSYDAARGFQPVEPFAALTRAIGNAAGALKEQEAVRHAAESRQKISTAAIWLVTAVLFGVFIVMLVQKAPSVAQPSVTQTSVSQGERRTFYIRPEDRASSSPAPTAQAPSQTPRAVAEAGVDGNRNPQESTRPAQSQLADPLDRASTKPMERGAGDPGMLFLAGTYRCQTGEGATAQSQGCLIYPAPGGTLYLRLDNQNPKASDGRITPAGNGLIAISWSADGSCDAGCGDGIAPAEIGQVFNQGSGCIPAVRPAIDACRAEAVLVARLRLENGRWRGTLNDFNYENTYEELPNGARRVTGFTRKSGSIQFMISR